ncbi:RNA polymerase I-specific transcription initiation factor RRN3 [Polypterus senegalus]|nr:RNA polymerase I-specific transcription initiation factor RRN3 [Polypterus senegalus]XP_039630529.1 RNA polymerase I-specific transcription initiation factor RRN3 [Polypterus senegalus]
MMDKDDGDFLNSPVHKTVRFGGSVAKILAKYKRGDTHDFELLKHQLSDPDIKDAQIMNWLQELRNCVTELTKEFEQLVFIVLKIPWLGRSPAVIEVYLAFLANLVSAQTVYLRSCLSMVVSNFTPGRIIIREDDVDISDSDDENENLPRSFDLCHRALQIIARYVPSTSRFLIPILREKFPFINKSPKTLECYVHNLLRITVSFPVLRREILELVIEKMLKLDVSASRNSIEEAEENAAQQAEEMAVASREECLFSMDEDEDNEHVNPPTDDRSMANPVAERLDYLMVILLAYVKDICFVNDVLELTRTKELYKDLIAIFDKLILPTHASSHVQFVIFYLCSSKLGLAEAFLEHLWKKVQSPNNPPVIRQSAAGYIGSFLARAKFIPIVTVKACLDLLVLWVHQYIDSQDTGSKAFCDVMLHGPFYAACQAIFYTLVFRHRQMVDGNLRSGLAYLQKLNLERIVMCRLNPLKVCLPAVTNMFAAIMRKYQLVFCYTIIERNNRQQLSVVRSNAMGDCVIVQSNPLDTFFPFDPYLLKRSGTVIHGIYQVWEETDVIDTHGGKQHIKQGCRGGDEDDDFLRGETPKNDSMEGITPGSYDSHLRSPSSVGSPPIAFLQRPF